MMLEYYQQMLLIFMIKLVEDDSSRALWISCCRAKTCLLWQHPFSLSQVHPANNFWRLFVLGLPKMEWHSTSRCNNLLLNSQMKGALRK
jgi:hypothetical protein